jgi:hypothetical protein
MTRYVGTIQSIALDSHHVEFDIGSKVLRRIVLNQDVWETSFLLPFLILVEVKGRRLGGERTTGAKVFNEDQSITEEGKQEEGRKRTKESR